MNLNSLSPQQKAFISVAVLLISAFVGAGLVALIVHLGLFLYAGYAMIIFGIYGLIKVIYEIEVHKFERQEQLKKVDK